MIYTIENTNKNKNKTKFSFITYQIEKMGTIKKDAIFNLLGKDYTLDIVKWQYENWRTYLWLIDKNGETFCDLTENHVEITNQELQVNLWNDGERVILDWDFIDFCGGERYAKIRLMDNLKNCLGGGDIDGYSAIVLFNN